MVAGGVARKLIFCWLGNPGVGGLNAIRRRIEDADPRAARDRGVQPLRDGRAVHGRRGRTCRSTRSGRYFETDLPKANPLIREIESPYGDGTVYAVPPLRPDVTMVHAQRADAAGNTQVWGLLGCQKEAAFAADRVIVVVEELVDEAVIRADPNRTIIPGLDRRRGRRRAVGRPPVVRPGRLRPRQPVLSRLGSDHAATRPRSRPGSRLGLRAGRSRRVRREARCGAGGVPPAVRQAPSGSVDYGQYR